MKFPTPKWDFGQVLYLKVDTDDGGMVTGYIIRPNGIVYLIGWGNASESEHYDIELTDEKVYGKEEP